MATLTSRRQLKRASAQHKAVYVFASVALTASASASWDVRRRRAATIVFAPGADTFELRTGSSAERCRATALRSLADARICAEGVPLVSLTVAPNHPCFRRFRAIGHEGVLALPNELFAPFKERLEAAYAGALLPKAASELSEAIIDAVLRCLPAAPPFDPRINQVIALLHESLDCSLDDLAAAARVSYFRLSHLFADSVGLSLRSYRSWQRLQRALSLLLLGHTQIAAALSTGFNDASHFNRMCFEEYGESPSSILKNAVTLQLPQVSNYLPKPTRRSPDTFS